MLFFCSDFPSSSLLCVWRIVNLWKGMKAYKFVTRGPVRPLLRSPCVVPLSCLLILYDSVSATRRNCVASSEKREEILFMALRKMLTAFGSKSTHTQHTQQQTVRGQVPCFGISGFPAALLFSLSSITSLRQTEHKEKGGTLTCTWEGKRAYSASPHPLFPHSFYVWADFSCLPPLPAFPRTAVTVVLQNFSTGEREDCQKGAKNKGTHSLFESESREERNASRWREESLVSFSRQ